MTHLARRKAAVFLTLTVAAIAGASLWRPRTRLSDRLPPVDLETMFPKQFGGWVADTRAPVQLVSPDTQATLSKIYSQTLSRTYLNDSGDRIMVSVAYGGDQSDASSAHRPEVCYPAQGFQVLSSAIDELDLGTHRLRVRRLVAKQGERYEPITYWIVVGELATVTGTEQKLAQLSYSTRGLIPDGMLVRVSSIDKDSERSMRVQDGFVRKLVAALSPDLRARVVGLTAVR